MHGSTSYKMEAKQEAAAIGYFWMNCLRVATDVGRDSINRKFAIVIAACRASCHVLTARISAIGFTVIPYGDTQPIDVHVYIASCCATTN